MRHRSIKLCEMKRVKIIYSVLLGLSYFFSTGQQIGNYVTNGNFENLKPNAVYPNIFAAPPVYIGWSSIDTTKNGFFSHHSSFGNSPSNSPGACDVQVARSGSGFVRNTVYIENSPGRGYFRNKLKAPLSAGVSYCVKYYVNVRECQPVGIDSYGAFFGNNFLDSINDPYQTLTAIIPQVENPIGNFVTDSVGWTLITGTFTALGNEKYMVLGNFKTSQSTGTIALINPVPSFKFCDVNIDDASVMEINGEAYAGPDKLIYPDDSTFIGRQPDYAVDPYCIWYKLPNTSIAIDTISGLWVKPAVTSTYIVRQELDCGSIKWDTVVVVIDTLPRTYVGLEKQTSFSESIMLSPNPTSGNLNVSFSAATGDGLNKYHIVSALGQILREEDVELTKSTFIIQTSDLLPGLYQIYFMTQFGVLTKKFVKTN